MSHDTLAGMRTFTNPRDEQTVRLFNAMPVNDRLEYLYRIAMTTDRMLQVMALSGDMASLGLHVQEIEGAVGKLGRTLDNDVQRIDRALKGLAYEIEEAKRRP
jgi:hypothetical protein